MTNDVYITGTGGTVIYCDNDDFFYRTLDDFETPHPCRAGDISFMLDCGAEFIRIDPFPGFDLLKPDIELERKKKQALSLTLSGLDNDLTEETRLMCIDAAEELASDERINLFLKARSLSRIIPEAADITGGLKCALSVNAVKIGTLYRNMRISQSYIEMVIDAWRKIAISWFDSTEKASIVENILIDAGFFSGMVEALQHERKNKLETLVVTVGMLPNVKRLHPQIVIILNDMKNLIIQKAWFIVEERENIDETNDIEVDQIDSDPIEELIQNCDLVVRKNIDGHEALAKVDSQIGKISGFINKGDLRRAEYFLYDLVKFNLATGDKSKLGKSLCQLTKNALVASAYSFAEKLSAYSMLLNIDDHVIYCTHAEIFRVKQQYREALEVYDKTIERFADDVVARTGRAEVLKEMGKYSEALEAYEDTIKFFTNDRYARNGFANVLILLGRSEEVPSLFYTDNIISKDDWLDYHVVAMSYLRTGNLNEAIKRLEYGLANIPFLDSKEYFANSLAYGKILKKEYGDIEPIFHGLPGIHNPFEVKKRHLFLVHSKAELNKTKEAIGELALVSTVSYIRLVNLREFLDKRYCLSGEFICSFSDEYVLLDKAIEEEELFLAMTRKTA